ncbi:MAG: HEAT repeat domain-containing protein [Planctomycetota bacterium]|nr:HEAT repeat domain-containing protein [Planctomycetota bacterium]
MLHVSSRGTILVCLALVGLGAGLGCRGVRAGRGNSNQAPTSIFGIFQPPTPAQAAAWAADEYDADKRYRGTLLLANAPFGGEGVYVEMYTKAAKDEDPAVRAAAIRGLALHGSPEHVPLILDQIEDPDRLLRWESARALQRLHNPAAVPALIRRLTPDNEEDPLVRAAAADALGQYPEVRVVDGLITALGDRDLAVNNAALRSLRTLTGQDLSDNVRAWVAWKKDRQDLFAARRPYIYPVFYRDKNWVEVILPVFSPPNEIAASPVGMDVSLGPGATPNSDSSQPADAPVRTN